MHFRPLHARVSLSGVEAAKLAPSKAPPCTAQVRRFSRGYPQVISTGERAA